MKPKTNREKVKHIRAFDKQFNVKRSKELNFLLMLARYTNGPDLTPQGWLELEELYQHIIQLEEGDECPKRGPEDEEKERTERYLQDGSNICPYCKSNNLEAGHIEGERLAAFCNVTCNSCGKEWTDEYKLTGVTWLEE